jgi:hypothetical protein
MITSPNVIADFDPAPIQNNKLGIYYDPTHVVSRDENGDPISFYQDDCWDFGAISTSRETSLSFYRPVIEGSPDTLQEMLHEQNKALLCKYIESGALKAFSTFYRLNLVCIKWCDYSNTLGIPLFEVLCDETLVEGFLQTLSMVDVAQSGSLITTLWKGRKRFNVNPKLTLLRSVVQQVMAGIPEHQQTPLIPSKIYSSILGDLIDELDVIEHHIPTLLAVLGTSKQLDLMLDKETDRNRRSAARNKGFMPFKTALAEMGFVASAKSGSVVNFVLGRIAQYQVTLMYVVIAFTGMRIGECQKLPVKGVLTSVNHLGREHWLVNGFTHKLHHGIKQPTTWITSIEGKRALELGRLLSDGIFEYAGKPTGDRYLFSSTNSPSKLRGTSGMLEAQSAVHSIVCPIITQEDLDELEVIRLDRDWALDGIEVGKPWPLAFHQLRRSLAVYAHRSGMVSLPSLKSQLQHITEEMTLYYSTGFQDAANVVFEEDHFSHEWNSSTAEASYFGAALGVLFGDDEILGNGAIWLKSEKVKQSPVSVHSREHALDLYKKGQLAFKETALGGCTSTEACKASPLEPIQYECLETNCPNLVVYGKRLDLVIRTQETFLANLAKSNPGSVEHRLESENLNTLHNARSRLKKVAP